MESSPFEEPAAEEITMCEVGKPIEIIDVEPLRLPASLRKEEEQPTEQPVTVEVPVSDTTTELVTVTCEKR
jgi:hypothetical protein